MQNPCPNEKMTTKVILIATFIKKTNKDHCERQFYLGVLFSKNNLDAIEKPTRW